MENKILTILVLFLIVSSIFIRWPGMNEYSRFFLTISLVFDNTFSINKYYNQTGDRSYYLGNYYSDKEPGVSFLVTPEIFIIKILFELFNYEISLKPLKYFIEYHNNTPIVVALMQPSFIRLSQFIAVFFASTLPTTIAGLLVYKIVLEYTKNEKVSMISLIVYLFSSMAFHYSLIFINHAMSSLIVLLSFYLLLKEKHGLSSVVAGIGFMVDPQILPIYFVMSLSYFVLKKMVNRFDLIMNVVFWFLVGSIPMLMYNFSIFENPFSFPREHLDPEIWPKLPGYHGMIIDPLYNFNSAIRMLFYPYRGIFFYYPIFLLSFLVFFDLDKKVKIVTFISLVVFLTNLTLSSMWWAWWHGASFSERHLVVSAPFLSILLGLSLKNKLKKKYFKLVFLILLIYSFMTNVVGLQKHYEDILKSPKNSFMKDYYKDRFEKFLPLENILFNYYYKNFFKNGVYSPIIYNLINKHVFWVVAAE